MNLNGKQAVRCKWTDCSHLSNTMRHVDLKQWLRICTAADIEIKSQGRFYSWVTFNGACSENLWRWSSLCLSTESHNVLTKRGGWLEWQRPPPPEGGRSAGGGADGLRFWTPLQNTHTHTHGGDVTHCQTPQGSAACTVSGKRNDLWILGEQSTNVHWALCPSTTWISDIKGSCLRSPISSSSS